MKKLNLIGNRYGMLLVISEAEKPKHVKRKGSYWNCKCDCGNETVVEGSNLGIRTLSCGCKRKHSLDGHRFNGEKQKDTNCRIYSIWKAMIQRCYSSKSKAYKDYGGRGITICEEWHDDFSSFRDWAMSNGYDPKAKRGQCTIDRIDVNGNYEPTNCRWVSMAVQNKNKRKGEKTNGKWNSRINSKCNN